MAAFRDRTPNSTGAVLTRADGRKSVGVAVCAKPRDYGVVALVVDVIRARKRLIRLRRVFAV